MVHTRFKRSPKAQAPRPHCALNNYELRVNIKYLRQRLGYWRDKSESLAYQVELGQEPPIAVHAAITETMETLRQFLAAIAERDIRNNPPKPHE